MREVTERRKQRIWSVINRRQKDLTLIMDNIHDPHNVSAVMRSCDAFGVKRVLLYYTTESFPLLGRKSSASAIKWVEIQQHSEAGAMLRPLREQGYQVLATGFGGDALPLPEWDMTLPTAVVFSNEHEGISSELRQWVDKEMYIPMQGMVESLNVSVAAAVILYEGWRQREKQGMYNTPDFSSKELEDLYRQWYKK